MESLVKDLRFALRGILRNPAFALIAITSLALGMGANAAIFSLINELFLKPLPIEAPDRVVRIFTSDERTAGNQSALSHLNWRDVGEQSSSFESYAGYDFVGVSLAIDGEPQNVPAQLVSANYFSTLGVQPHRGRFFLPVEDQTPLSHPVAVLSHDFWTEQLGAADDAISSLVRINGQPFTVVGVAPPEFEGLATGFGPTVWLPMMMNQLVLNDPRTNWYDERRGLFLAGVARLADGISIDDARSELSLIAARLERDFPDDNEGRGLEVLPVAETTVFNRGGVMRGMSTLMVTVGIVLLIACTNVAGLLVARSDDRRREIAVRLAMGVDRARLVRQLLTESLTLSILGATLGLFVAYLARESLLDLLGNLPVGLGLALDMPLDVRVLVFTGGLALVTGLLFGLWPALQSSKPQLISAIKDDGDVSLNPGRRLTTLNVLVVVQLALSLVALVCAGLFARSLAASMQLDLGFESDRLGAVSFNSGRLGYEEEQGIAFYQRVRDELAAIPGVEQAVLSQATPLQATILRSVYPEGETPQERTFVQVGAIGPGYLEMMGIEIEEGRAFTDADRAGSVPVVIVNRKMADTYWPGEPAVGQRFHFFDMDPVEVVGVAEVVAYNAPGEQPQGYAYLPLQQHYVTNMSILLRTTGDPGSALLESRTILHRMAPDLVVNTTTADEVLSGALAGQRSTALFLGALGLVALVLASIGVYGVMANSVRRRTREIGIRMALGAGSRKVLVMVVLHGLTLAVAGIVIGSAVALAVTRLISQLLFVSPFDPLAFAGTITLLLTITLLAALIPASRAARLNPIKALREMRS